MVVKHQFSPSELSFIRSNEKWDVIFIINFSLDILYIDNIT